MINMGDLVGRAFLILKPISQVGSEWRHEAAFFYVPLFGDLGSNDSQVRRTIVILNAFSTMSSYIPNIEVHSFSLSHFCLLCF